MYSEDIRNYIKRLEDLSGEDTKTSLLKQIFACFIASIGKAMNAETYPIGDFLDSSLGLLLLSDAIADEDEAIQSALPGAHYIVGLGFEQTGLLPSQLSLLDSSDVNQDPLLDSQWYRLALSVLHYLAGGFRVQALAALRHLKRISEVRSSDNAAQTGNYWDGFHAIERLYQGLVSEKTPKNLSPRWQFLFNKDPLSHESHERLIQRLVIRIRQRSGSLLAELGQNNVRTWLEARSLGDECERFWRDYISGLHHRGITTFTPEQVGPGFDIWLRPETDLLVILPTGSGKSLIGELKSALALADDKQVVWMLPTRALVRQTKRDLGRAFRPLGVSVEELPTTEDVRPLFSEMPGDGNLVAATTPEKLSALIRSNPQALQNVGLIVFDEAQLLLDDNRGITAEQVLHEIRTLNPSCRLTLMTAFSQARDALNGLLQRLGSSPCIIESSIRPTRRIYGVISVFNRGKGNDLGAALYPPEPQNPEAISGTPSLLFLPKIRIPKTPKPLSLGIQFAKRSNQSNLRSVIFVSQKQSTETQARKIAADSKSSENLPDGILARLEVELARDSAIEQPSRHKVSPHHAGLTALEQHLVETLVWRGYVKTVIATPTLAQGVNLPFDMSIVTFLQRFDEKLKRQVPLPSEEVLNMLGRAGRAGYVSDGICLIALDGTREQPKHVLQRHARRFFAPSKQQKDLMGMAGLLMRAKNANVASRKWLDEVSGMELHEIQLLMTFALKSISEESEPYELLLSGLRQYPSVFLQGEVTIEQSADMLYELVTNVQKNIGNDSQLLELIQKTGLPLQYLRSVLELVREFAAEVETEPEIDWIDEVVHASLSDCIERTWLTELLKKKKLEHIIFAIKAWRQGSPMSTIETQWPASAREANNRIAVNYFFNRGIALFSQFWGAVSLSFDMLRENQSTTNFSQQVPALIREGVSSVDTLIWLQGLGGLDRVLAHKISAFVPLGSGSHSAKRRRSLRILRNWKNAPDTMPDELDDISKLALGNVLEDSPL